MWSDRLPEVKRRRMAQRLRTVLPAPAPGARGALTPLRSGSSGPRGAPTPEQVAEELRSEPGFVWLDGWRDGGTCGHRFFTRPLAVLTVRGGRSTVEGPGGRATFKSGGFDLLEAVFAAWGGPSRGLLVHFDQHPGSTGGSFQGAEGAAHQPLGAWLRDGKFAFEAPAFGEAGQLAQQELADSA